jgi:hypothetical protein
MLSLALLATWALLQFVREISAGDARDPMCRRNIWNCPTKR